MTALPTPFTLSACHDLARICKRVYPGPLNQRQLSFEGQPLTGQRMVHGSFGRAYSRLFWTDDTVIVAFRGTRENVDWRLSNLRALPQPLRDCGPRARPLVHRGFQETLDFADKTTGLRSLDALFGHLESDGLLERRIVVTGHSLGGALALLFAVKLAARHPQTCDERLSQIVTFGAPAAGLRGFRRLYRDLSDRTLRVVNDTDIVPFTPPMFYRHVGRTLWLGPRDPKPDPGWPRRLQLTASGLFARAIADHAIEAYVDRLAAAARR